MAHKNDIKVLITRDFPELAAELLNSAGFSVTPRTSELPMTHEELLFAAKAHNALLCSGGDRIDANFLNECSHLDIISQYAVGYDNIDINKATDLGIPVGYTPDVLSDATAEIAFGLMIAVSRKLFYHHKTIIQGEWKYFRPRANLGIELKYKTLGIFGLGRIGYEMARLCKSAYGMEIIYHNRNRNSHAEQILGARLVDFNTLLSQSDIISVHCSLNEKTREVFNKEAFAKMKPTSIFINTARGKVHNETDLYEALKNKIIWGAGLDVTNPEPMLSTNPLLSMENVAVLPHIGSATLETREKMAQIAADNIIEFYRNDRVPFVVNPESMKMKRKKSI